jgi:hypothetical protein
MLAALMPVEDRSENGQRANGQLLRLSDKGEAGDRFDSYMSTQRSHEVQQNVKLEVFTAVTVKNDVFWDVMPCASCKNRRFGGTWRLPSKESYRLRTRLS